MAYTLADIRSRAHALLENKEIIEALKMYRLILQRVPDDFTLRFEIADILDVLGFSKQAICIYRAIAVHNIKVGEPFAAIVAIKLLEREGEDVGALMQHLAKAYSTDSTMLGRGIKPAPMDYDVPVEDDIELKYQMDQEQLVRELISMTASLDNTGEYPPIVPPIAILSTLQTSPFARLLENLELKRHKDGDAVVREGEVGEALYFIARGEVKVTKQTAEGKSIDLARLGAGSIFGEMALISSEPRGATVTCLGGADLFELTKAKVEQLGAEIPVIGGVMNRFTRDRLIANLLATNPLFKPFSESAKKDLLGRFAGHDVPQGTIFVEQGKPGKGLYIILQGEAEVLSWDGSEYVPVATLKTGDLVGEISLIHESNATATVRTTTRATLLFLARELFYPLVEAVPELLTHFARLANERMSDTESKLEENRAMSEAFIEELDAAEVESTELEELDSDDLVML